MAYDIVIGEAELYHEGMEEVGARELPIVRIYPKAITNEDAPNLIDTKRSNRRSIAHGVLPEWCSKVGLTALFYDKECGLLSIDTELGSVAGLTKFHLHVISKAKLDWENKFPQCVNEIVYVDKFPTNYRQMSLVERERIDRGFDWDYSRLVWFEYWVDWALKNCKIPVIGH